MSNYKANEHCAGCGPSVGGEYRPGEGFYLCDDCYENSAIEEYQECDRCKSRNIRYSMTLKEDCCFDCGGTKYTWRDGDTLCIHMYIYIYYTYVGVCICP